MTVVSRLGRDAEPVVFNKLVQAWEEAYGRYMQVLQGTESASSDAAAAWELAEASRAVAATWRKIGQARGLPWWSVAAVESAAQAFEDQSRQWEHRCAQNGRSRAAHGVGRPRPWPGS